MNTTESTQASGDLGAEELFRKASKMYKDRPELDPTKDRELQEEFANCANADDVMKALEKRVTGLKDFREDRWAKLRAKLKPVVGIVLQVTSVAAESAQTIVCMDTCLSLLMCVISFASARVFLVEKLCLLPLVCC